MACIVPVYEVGTVLAAMVTVCMRVAERIGPAAVVNADPLELSCQLLPNKGRQPCHARIEKQRPDVFINSSHGMTADYTFLKVVLLRMPMPPAYGRACTGAQGMYLACKPQDMNQSNRACSISLL